MNAILPKALRDKLPRLVAEGNPWASYPIWHRDPGQDPSWVNSAPWHEWYLTYVATGDEDALKRVLAMELRAEWPDPFPDNQLDNALRQEGVDACLRYMVLKDHLTPEQRDEWTRRLAIMGWRMLDIARVGDLDVCLAFYASWKLLDALGIQGPWVDFLVHRHEDVSADKVAGAHDYIVAVMTDEQIDGGFFDASSSYFMNNAQIWLTAGAALGKDVLPNFDKWAKEAAGYFANSVAYDCSFAQSSGDMGGNGIQRPEEIPDMTLLRHYRFGCMWSLIGLGYDTEHVLRRLCARLAKDGVVEGPQSLYPAGHQTWAFLFLDPEDMPRTGLTPLVEPYGLYDCKGAGIFIHHTDDASLFGHMLTPKWDDHAYPGTATDPMGSWFDVVWRDGGEMILERPGGYARDTNQYWNHNGVALDEDGMSVKREYYGATELGDGFVAKGKFFSDTGQNLVTTVEYSPNSSLAITDWWSDGTDSVTRVIHTRHKPTETTNGWAWTLPSGRKVFATAYSLDVIAMGVHEKGPWWEIRFEAQPQGAEGEMEMVISITEPEQPDQSLEHDGVVWSFGGAVDGGFLCLADGVPAGGAGMAYAVTTAGKLALRNSYGNWFQWDGQWSFLGEGVEPELRPQVSVRDEQTVVLSDGRRLTVTWDADGLVKIEEERTLWLR